MKYANPHIIHTKLLPSFVPQNKPWFLSSIFKPAVDIDQIIEMIFIWVFVVVVIVGLKNIIQTCINSFYYVTNILYWFIWSVKHCPLLHRYPKFNCFGIYRSLSFLFQMSKFLVIIFSLFRVYLDSEGKCIPAGWVTLINLLKIIPILTAEDEKDFSGHHRSVSGRKKCGYATDQQLKLNESI